MTDTVSPIVIDNGSGMCKAGVSGDDAPRIAFLYYWKTKILELDCRIRIKRLLHWTRSIS
jgi:actin-related protein